jgi:iron complex transport system permease protein
LALATLSFLSLSRSRSIVARLAVVGGVLAALLAAVSLVSMTMGPVHIPLSHVADVALGPLGLDIAAHTRTEELVVTQLRLPRVLVGALVGMALGVAGTVMQGLFRNPMADPGVIGVSAGAAAGAVLCIALGLSGLFFLALPFFAFAGAVGAIFVVYGISLAGGRFSMATLLLAGVAVSAFLSALVSAMLILAPSGETVRQILFWLAGGLDSRSWEHVGLSAPVLLPGIAGVLVLSRDLNLLMLGDDEAKSLGVRVSLVRPVLLVLAAMITGVAVAVSGIISFVGLVAPHMLRLILGPDHRLLVPASALGGALFLVGADTLARTLIQPAEVQVGIVTAFVGAPFFIFLLLRNKRRAEAF